MNKAKLVKKKDIQKLTAKPKSSSKAVKKQDSFTIAVSVKIAGRGSEASKARSTWAKLFGK